MNALRIERWGRRNHAVYVGDNLLVVTLYRVGAEAVKAALEGKPMVPDLEGCLRAPRAEYRGGIPALPSAATVVQIP